LGWERSRASLRCRLGRHAPRKGAHWNEGYYFTRCTRCGADLVRTTFSGWEEPRGYRVVWRRKAELANEHPPVAATATEPPLRALRIAAETAAPPPPPQPPAPPPPSPAARLDPPPPLRPPPTVEPPEQPPIRVPPPRATTAPTLAPPPEPVEPASVPEPPRRRRSAIPDFMDDPPSSSRSVPPADGAAPRLVTRGSD